MSEITISFLILTVALIGLLIITTFSFMKEKRELREMWSKDRESWNKERQQLIDRIQAPSFAEYKHAEITKVKVENKAKEKPEDKLEEV